MYNFFTNNKSTISYPIRKFSKFKYIEDKYKYELNKIKDYYSFTRERAVPNGHPISKLVDLLSPSINLELNDYYKEVAVNAKYIARQLEFTSNINKGKPFNNIFYKSNSQELLITTEEYFDLEEYEFMWRDSVSIRCIYNELTDLDFSVPFGDKELSRASLSVYEIDIVKVLMQYRYWCKERIALAASTNSNVFVAMIVLPNMIKSITNISLFNRLLKKSVGVSIKSFDINHPFNVLDYSKGVDKIYKSVNKHIKGKNMALEQVILHIPLLDANPMDVLHITHKYYTKQSEWVLWLARTSYIARLLEFMGDTGMRANLDLINRLPTLIKQLEQGSTNFDSGLDKIHVESFEQNIKIIKKKVGNR